VSSSTLCLNPITPLYHLSDGQVFANSEARAREQVLESRCSIHGHHAATTTMIHLHMPHTFQPTAGNAKHHVLRSPAEQIYKLDNTHNTIMTQLHFEL